MITLNKAKRTILLCHAILLTLVLTSCAKEQAPIIKIATGSVTGSYSVAGMELARVVNLNEDVNGFHLADELTTGSTANIDALSAGTSQFGIAQTDDQHRAVQGLGEWKDKGPQKELRAVFTIYLERLALVAGGDSGIVTIKGLKGKKVNLGPVGSGTRRNAIEALSAAGIDWKTDIESHENEAEERLAAFMRGGIDAFFFTAGHPNKEIRFASYSQRGARLISLINIDSFLSENPYLISTTIPVELYPMLLNRNDVETIGAGATVLTSANVPDEVVYAVTKAAFENQNLLTRFDAFRDDYFLKGLSAPIHPGALKYYQEIGIQVPAN